MSSPYLPSKYLYWLVTSSLSISKLFVLSIFTFKVFVLVCHIFPVHIKTSWLLHIYLQSICIGLSHLPYPYQNFLASPYLPSKYLYWFVTSSLSISKLLGLSIFTFKVFVLVCHIFPVHIKTSWPLHIYLQSICIGLSHLPYPYQNFLASPYLALKYLYWFVTSSLSYQHFLASPYLPSKYLYWFVTSSLSISTLLGLSIFTFKVFVLVCHIFPIHIKTSWSLHIYLQSICIGLSHLPYPYQNFLASPYLPSKYLYWFVTSSLSISKLLGLSIFTFKVSVLVCHIFPIHIKTSCPLHIYLQSICIGLSHLPCPYQNLWPLHIYFQSICIGWSHLPYPYQNFLASPYLLSKYLYWLVTSTLSISKPLASPYLLSKYLYWLVTSTLSISKLLGLAIFTFKVFVLACHIFPIHIKTMFVFLPGELGLISLL